MSDSKTDAADYYSQKIDWDAVRGASSDCLNATWTLICHAEWLQDSDCNESQPVAFLASIDKARFTFTQAIEVLRPPAPWLASSSPVRYSPVFDAIALVTANQNGRPDFQFGPVCCATAHETAFELLRWAILSVETGLVAELDSRGSFVWRDCRGIDDLHGLSPIELRETLMRLEKENSIQKLIHERGTRLIRSWIDREWAAVIDRTPNIHNTVILKSCDIRERYELSEKQIRDWAKDERKPFIKTVEGQRKYELKPHAAELTALKKMTRSDMK
ncbi:hypothetical protein N9L06_01490 [Mariniblastus sp.]|nr:hypothetical protein [Mariniblastus sp.]